MHIILNCLAWAKFDDCITVLYKTINILCIRNGTKHLIPFDHEYLLHATERYNIRYQCPERLTDAEGCQYRGKLYKVGEAIKDQLLPQRCFESCTCERWVDEG